MYVPLRTDRRYTTSYNLYEGTSRKMHGMQVLWLVLFITVIKIRACMCYYIKIQ